MGLPKNDDRALIVCDKLGNIMTYKWHASALISEKMLELPEYSYIQSFELINSIEAVISWCNNKYTYVGICNIESGRILHKIGKIKDATKWCIAVQYLNDRSFVAFTNGPSTVCIFDSTNPLQTLVSRSISSLLYISSLAWHPSEELLAVGDSLGRIILWRNPTRSTKIAKEICHWHHLPLNSIVFTPRGGSMLSGGLERVMVAWGANNSRKFLPRLPHSILHVAASNTHIVISTADNGLQIVETGSFNVLGCIREAGGLGGAKSKVSKGPSLQYARSSASLLLPAGSGHLHLYSTISNSLLYTMDVTNTNLVHPERQNLEPEQIEINKIVIGCKSQWLVTWEGRDEYERIRWWEWNNTEWKLHTISACPHSPATPIDIHMAQDTSVTITADQDNTIRFWRLFDSIPGHDKAVWHTNAKSSKNMGKAGGIALTTDGSVAAAWYDSRLTLYDTFKGVKKNSLAHPYLRPQGKLVCFGRDHLMHFVACTTDTCLGVWNVITSRLIWTVKLNTSCLISDPFSDRMAAITEENDVFIFKINDPEVELKLSNALPIDQGKITSAAFAPSESGQADFKLYLLREQQELFTVERSDLAVDNGPALESTNISLQPKLTAYSAMIAEKQTIFSKEHHVAPRTQFSTKSVIKEMLLSSPAHTLPRLSTLCRPLLESISRDMNGSLDPVVIPDEKLTESMDDEEQCVNVKSTISEIMKESMDWVEELLR